MEPSIGIAKTVAVGVGPTVLPRELPVATLLELAKKMPAESSRNLRSQLPDSGSVALGQLLHKLPEKTAVLLRQSISQARVDNPALFRPQSAAASASAAKTKSTPAPGSQSSSTAAHSNASVKQNPSAAAAQSQISKAPLSMPRNARLDPAAVTSTSPKAPTPDVAGSSVAAQTPRKIGLDPMQQQAREAGKQALRKLAEPTTDTAVKALKTAASVLANTNQRGAVTALHNSVDLSMAADATRRASKPQTDPKSSGDRSPLTLLGEATVESISRNHRQVNQSKTPQVAAALGQLVGRAALGSIDNKGRPAGKQLRELAAALKLNIEGGGTPKQGQIFENAQQLLSRMPLEQRRDRLLGALEQQARSHAGRALYVSANDLATTPPEALSRSVATDILRSHASEAPGQWSQIAAMVDLNSDQLEKALAHKIGSELSQWLKDPKIAAALGALGQGQYLNAPFAFVGIASAFQLNLGQSVKMLPWALAISGGFWWLLRSF